MGRGPEAHAFDKAKGEGVSADRVLGALANRGFEAPAPHGADHQPRPRMELTIGVIPTKSAVVGEFSSAQLFVGDGFRVDTSTEAGTR